MVRNRARTSAMRLDFIVVLVDVNPAEWWTGETPVPPLPLLFLVHEVAATILLPATFVRLGAEWFLLAVADGLDAIAADSGLDERILHGVRAIGAQGEVIFGGAALVAMSLDGDVDVGMLLQEACIALHRALVGGAYIVLVVVEVNIFDVLSEELLLGSRGSRRRCRWWRVDGHASSGVLSSAGAFGDEMVGGRIGWSHLARAAYVDWADAVDADVGRVGGLPG